MMKQRYFIDNSFKCPKKYNPATSACQLLETIDCIFQIFTAYAEESDGYLLTRTILNNVIQNNENIFGPKPLETLPCASTLSETQANKQCLGSMPEGSNSRVSRKQLNYKDKNEELEKIAQPSVANTKEFENFCEIFDRLNSLTKNVDTDAFKTKGIKKERNFKERWESYEKSKKDTSIMVSEDLMQITSMSIMKQSNCISVEIDIYRSGNLEQDSVLSDNTNSLADVGRNIKFYSDLSKHLEPSPCDSSFTIDYTDSNILYFLTQRLMSLLSCRHMYMEKIHNCFGRFLNFVNCFDSCITRIKLFLQEFSMENEENLSHDLIKKHIILINKISKMSEKMQPLIRDVKNDVAVWEYSLEEIEDFVKKQRQLLSSNEIILTISDLKELQFRFNEKCKQAIETLIPQDERREFLFNLSIDFEWFSKLFVKFLILTGILKPSPLYGNDKENQVPHFF